jgi:hypothetical protein
MSRFRVTENDAIYFAPGAASTQPPRHILRKDDEYSNRVSAPDSYDSTPPERCEQLEPRNTAIQRSDK